MVRPLLLAAALLLLALTPPAQAAAPGAGTVSAAAPVAATAAQSALRDRLGTQSVLSVDPATGTPRALGRLDGYLTPNSGRPARAVALDYVRGHLPAFGLDAQDVDALGAPRSYTADGMTFLEWSQAVQGVPAIDTSLTAAVTTGGRLLSVGGAPAPDLALDSVEPGVTAAAAYATAADRLGGAVREVRDRAAGAQRLTTFARGGEARLVVYQQGPRPRLGWRLRVPVDSQAVYDVIVDARTGTVQRTFNYVREATGNRFENYPSAPVGGTEGAVSFDPFLTAGATTLTGPNAHTFLDVDDEVVAPGDAVPADGEVPPAAGGDWTYAFTPVDDLTDDCSPLPCVWDDMVPFSWQANDQRDATQVHWFVNTFHDHLQDTPEIAFTEEAGAFDGEDDPLLAQSMDGANTLAGLPDTNHVDNANMATYPQGTSPHMQMYLTSFQQPASTGFDSTVIYHEYTHGLVGRTITDADGVDSMRGPQSGAINEGTADWYALDYVTAQGLEADTDAVDVTAAKFTFGELRSEPTDCLVTSTAADCPGSDTAGTGGYTYGDFGRVIDRPEVHADGEIFTQTMWQLRQTLIAKDGATAGLGDVRSIYTTGMRLSPPNPSFLDLRNAMLQAAVATDDVAEVWDVFASRGMGYFASTTGAGDVEPVEDFSDVPAEGGPTGTVTGTVTDPVAGTPVAGALVGFTGHDAGVGPDLTATTNAAGRYTIAGVPAGTYPQLRVRAAGYEQDSQPDVTITPDGTATADLAIRRDHAALAGGAKIRSAQGEDFSDFGCGPAAALDGEQGSTWSTGAPASPTDPGTKDLVVELPAGVTVSAFAIDPSAGCGDDPPASLAAYQLAVSTTGESFTAVQTGTFTPADVGALKELTPTATPPGTRFVRLRMISNQGDPAFMDVTELRVFGKASVPPEATATTSPTATATPTQTASPSPSPSPTATATTSPSPSPTAAPTREPEAPLNRLTGARGRAARIACAVRGDRVRCVATVRKARGKRAKATLRRGARTLARGQARRARRGRIVLTGTRGLASGRVQLRVRTGKGRKARTRTYAIRLRG